jgi:hypothetical protein
VITYHVPSVVGVPPEVDLKVGVQSSHVSEDASHVSDHVHAHLFIVGDVLDELGDFLSAGAPAESANTG